MTLATVTAAPGMSGRDVERASSASLTLPDPRRRHATLQPHGPHGFVLACADEWLALGDSLFSVIELEHGTVHRLRTTPQLGYLDPRAALARAEALLERLESAGFEPRERVERQVVARIAREHPRVRVSEHALDVRGVEWRAELWLRITLRAASATARLFGLAHDACLVTLIVHDRARRIGGSR
jgi:hypothetical protein